MPDWNDYFFGYGTSPTNCVDTGTSSGTWSGVPLSATQIQQEYEEYQREQERQDRIWKLQMEQQVEEEKQLIKDKEKYPLFFLKEGIV